jgi:hypothetical protein
MASLRLMVGLSGRMMHRSVLLVKVLRRIIAGRANYYLVNILDFVIWREITGSRSPPQRLKQSQLEGLGWIQR